MKFVVYNDPLVDEFASLFALFKKSGSEMNVEYVQRRVIEPDVGAQTAAALTASRTDVVVLITLDWKTSEDDIPVAATLVPPILPKRKVKSQLLGHETCLVFFARSPFETDNFLKGHDIGMQLAQDLHDSLRPHESIHAAALVNVISNDAEGTDRISHLRQQPAVI